MAAARLSVREAKLIPEDVRQRTWGASNHVYFVSCPTSRACLNRKAQSTNRPANNQQGRPRRNQEARRLATTFLDRYVLSHRTPGLFDHRCILVRLDAGAKRLWRASSNGPLARCVSFWQ